MGSLIGHIVPGSCFLLFSFWWTISIFRRYFDSHFRGTRYVNTASFKCWSLPIESFGKMALMTAGIVGEYVTGFENGKFTHLHNGQHMTMYGFFFFNAAFELMYHYRVAALPPKLDYLSAALGFGIEGFLFAWHLHGRPPMDVQVHTFVVYGTILCTGSVLLEMLLPHDVRPALARAVFTMLQGTWFYQVGFVLYPPWEGQPWAQDDHKEMMIITMMFTWHLAAILAFQILVGLVMYHRVKGKLTKQGVRLRSNNNNGYKSLPTQDSALPLLLDDEEESVIS